VTTTIPARISSQLGIGSRGGDVTALQTFLASDSSIYPSGLITGYFGQLTSNAVKAFQAKYGISQVGRVGPQTLAKINELMGSGGLGSGGVSTGGDVTAPSIFNVSIASSTTVSGGTTSTSTASTTSTPNQNSGMITVSWNTNEPASGKFYYSQTPFALTEVMTEKTEPVIGGFVVTNNNYNTSNSLQISNLNPATTYYYIIQARDAAGNVSLTWPNTFRTQ
jgi:peptidoglycan hydrolase-like protein with peptidoglycan-binding domain